MNSRADWSELYVETMSKLDARGPYSLEANGDAIAIGRRGKTSNAKLVDVWYLVSDRAAMDRVHRSRAERRETKR